MYRVTWRSGQFPPRLVPEDEWIEEMRRMAATGFADAPEGAVIVEALDADSRVRWHGSYRDAVELQVLLRQLLIERQIAHGGATP